RPTDCERSVALAVPNKRSLRRASCPHAPRRAADHNRIWGNVLGHDTASRNDAASAYRDAFEDDGVETDPDVVLDADGRSIDTLQIARMTGGRDGDELAVPQSRVVRVSVAIMNVHIVRNQHPIPNLNRHCGPDP